MNFVREKVSVARDNIIQHPHFRGAYQAATAIPEIDHVLTLTIFTAMQAPHLLFLKMASGSYWPLFAVGLLTHPGFTLAALTLPIPIKSLVRRDRPFRLPPSAVGKLTPITYRGYGTVYPGWDAYSFPSGHAWMAAALSFRLLTFPYSVLGLPWLLCVSLERVVNGSHFLLDVLVGVFLGVLHAQAGLPPLAEAILAALAGAWWLLSLKGDHSITIHPKVPQEETEVLLAQKKAL